MNLVWQIMKKDVRRVAWILGLWAGSGIYLTAYRKFAVVQGSLWDNLGVFSLMTFVALTCALIAMIVQEDGLAGSNEFWRTRPIAPGKLLTAKLGLIFACYVVLPVVVVVVQSWLFETRLSVADLPYTLPVLAVMVLSCAAMASVTKDLGQYFLGGILCLMVSVMLALAMTEWIELDPPSKANVLHYGMARLQGIVAVVGLASIIVLANQYFLRRKAASYATIAMAVVVTALVGAFWRWPLL
ncbi:MAG: hypothetical protein KA257_14500 [Opitutaceae bacterium]|nr:hypothetical protein [Opitutaceae bacterium]